MGSMSCGLDTNNFLIKNILQRNVVQRQGRESTKTCICGSLLVCLQLLTKVLSMSIPVSMLHLVPD